MQTQLVLDEVQSSRIVESVLSFQGALLTLVLIHVCVWDSTCHQSQVGAVRVASLSPDGKHFTALTASGACLSFPHRFSIVEPSPGRVSRGTRCKGIADSTLSSPFLLFNTALAVLC